MFLLMVITAPHGGQQQLLAFVSVLCVLRVSCGCPAAHKGTANSEFGLCFGAVWVSLGSLHCVSRVTPVCSALLAPQLPLLLGLGLRGAVCGLRLQFRLAQVEDVFGLKLSLGLCKVGT